MLGSCSLSAGFGYPRPAKEQKSAREGQGPAPCAAALPLCLCRQEIAHKQNQAGQGAWAIRSDPPAPAQRTSLLLPMQEQ